MEVLGIPEGYRAAVHRLYEKVRAKIKTSEGTSECFGSDICVKQGCPLSPTLFGLNTLISWKLVEQDRRRGCPYSRVCGEATFICG
jgi:hypothetical protein